MQRSDNSPVPFKRILITGGRGRLASVFAKLVPTAIAIDRDELDITDAVAVERYLADNPCELLIHCAAYTDVAAAEKNRDECYRINVIGTKNLITSFRGSKFVYISTDYVFDGTRGNYREDDEPSPINYYAHTKYQGEQIVRRFANTLIIRTSFKADGPWPYPKAFSDVWSTADYLSNLAPQLLAAALMPDLMGIIHIAGPKKTILDLAREQTPTVQSMSRNDIPTPLPYDISLNTDRWQRLWRPNDPNRDTSLSHS